MTALLLVFLMAAGLLPAGCTSLGGTSNSEIVPDITEAPADAAARLAKSLSAAKTLEEARPAVRETLARLGVTVRDKQGGLVAHPTSPTVEVRYFEFQADNLALDHMEHQGFTMSELAKCLSEVPVEGSAYWEDPKVLRAFLGGMVEAAEAAPGDPRAFGPLMLEQLALQREFPGSLKDEALEPADFAMTNLEVLLFSVSVRRGLALSTATGDASTPATDVTLGDPGPAPAARPGGAAAPSIAALDLFAPTPAYALDANPCTWMEGMLGKDAADIGQGAAGWGEDNALEGIATKVAEGASDLAQKSAKYAAKSVGYLTALISLVLTQGGFSIVVAPDPLTSHYYWSDPEHGNLKAKFVAYVDSRPVTDKELQACLQWIGVELPDEKSAENATVRWTGRYGIKGSSGPEHAEVSLEGMDMSSGAGGGRLEQRVKNGRAELQLIMKGEKDSKVQKTGKLKKDKIVVQAELFTENPGGGKLIGWLFGGVPDAMKFWADRWFPKRAVGTMPVQWHQGSRWRLILDNKNGTRTVFTSGEGLESIWDVKLEGAIEGQPFTGATQVDLRRDSTEFTLVGKGTFVDDGETTQMTATYQFLDVSIGGTPEAPTLDIGGMDAKIVATAEGGGGNASARKVGPVRSFPLEPYNE